jgi:hypothetical protein
MRSPQKEYGYRKGELPVTTASGSGSGGAAYGYQTLNG